MISPCWGLICSCDAYILYSYEKCKTVDWGVSLGFIAFGAGVILWIMVQYTNEYTLHLALN